MRLELDFVIYASLLIAALLPLYIYRKRIFRAKYSDNGFSFFIKDLKLHMSEYHPKIKIDYSIIEKTQNEGFVFKNSQHLFYLTHLYLKRCHSA